MQASNTTNRTLSKVKRNLSTQNLLPFNFIQGQGSSQSVEYLQLSVFTLPLAVDTVAVCPRLVFEPVPRELQIAPGRNYAFIEHGDRRWKFPYQLTEFEVAALPVLLKQIDLDLDAEGNPYDIEEIYQVLENNQKIRSCANSP